MTHLTQIHISFSLWKYKAKREDIGSSKMWEEEEDEDEMKMRMPMLWSSQGLHSLGISWEAASS